MNEKNTVAHPELETLKELYKGAFWVYTLIISFAIREVLVHILPRVFNYYWQAGFSEPTPSRASFYLEVARSVVFLLMITRFYLGSVKVLEELKHKVDKDKDAPKGSWLHVFIGTSHFVLFFGWALTAFSPAQPWHVSLFLWVLIAILLWDVTYLILWVCLGEKAPTEKRMFERWMVRNLLTLLCGIVLFVGSYFWCPGPPYAEVLALVPVLVISVVELYEMLSNRESLLRILLGRT